MNEPWHFLGNRYQKEFFFLRNSQVENFHPVNKIQRALAMNQNLVNNIKIHCFEKTKVFSINLYFKTIFKAKVACDNNTVNITRPPVLIIKYKIGIKAKLNDTPQSGFIVA